MADNGLFDRISHFTEKEKIAFKKKALVFSFFLVLSIIFWLMNALSKNYTTEIKYPVRYRNFPMNKTLIGELPNFFELKVSAHGYTLLRHKLSSRYIPLVFSVNSFSLNHYPEKDSSFYYLETRYLNDYISKQLSSEFKIINIEPDTIVFPFAEVISKKVPVVSGLVYKLSPQLVLKSQPDISPDSVLVSGPDYIIDTLKSVYTKTVDVGLIDKSIQESTSLRKMKHIKVDIENVSVTLDVEKFTEKDIVVPLKMVNTPDSLNIKLFPHNIEVSCLVGLSNFEKLDPYMFKATVDYNEIDAKDVERLTINLQTQVDFVKSVKFSPKTVEYLIVK